jgi:hypothetical protein
MLPSWYALGTLGVLLELVLLWRVCRERLWRHYPFFSTFLAYLLSSMLAQLALLRWYGLQSRAYASFYWTSDLVGIALWAFVAWEIFRHSFPRGSSLRTVVGGVSLLLASAMTGVLFLAHGNLGLPRSVGSFTVHFTSYASLVLAPLVLWLIVAAHYYRIPLGRNIWGMAIGFGIFLSLSAVNAAAYLLGHSSRLLSLLTTPGAFVLQLMIWTWVLWRYAPNPALMPAPAPREHGELELVLWRQEWNRLLDTMRKAFER